MKRALLLFVIGSVGLWGCGRSDLPELGDVTGVVTLAGKPLPDAIVTFTPTAEGRPSTGHTDADGRFTLQYTLDAEGAMVGQHAVTVRLIVDDEADDLPTASEWAEMPADEKAEYEAEGITGPANELPPAASDGSIAKEVKAGSNKIDIEL